MDRVIFTVTVDMPGVLLQLQPPPDRGAPSAKWMERLASLLQPVGGQRNMLRCCLPGSMEEVSSHLWQHQVLWMHLQFPEGGGTERRVAAQLDELLEAAADLSSGHYKNVVTLEEEMLDGSGEVVVGIELEAVRGGGPPPPSIPVGFVLHLEVSQGGSAVVAQAVAEFCRGDSGLQVRCSGVEQPLQSGVRHLLVLAQSWSEVSQMLSELDACIQVPLESLDDFTEVPLDFSPLCAAASKEGGTDCVEAEVHSEVFQSLGQGLSLKASVRSVQWDCGGGIQPGRSKDAELWAGGMADSPRMWRCSVEVRSIRLTSRTANIFVVYAYGPFRQPRPFRTNPPTVARKNITVCLPHSFAAYTMIVAEAELREQLEEPLHVEVWHRDLYKTDGPIGFVDASVSPVFESPLQYSDSMPSMVQGFRVLDQVCPLISSEDPESRKIGAIRLVVFLEDVGRPAAAAAVGTTAGPMGTSAREQGTGQSAGTTISPLVGAAASVVDAITSESIPIVEHVMPAEAPELSRNAELASNADASGLASLRGATTYELEVWRRAEEEKFRAYLTEQEGAMRALLEEKYRQRERTRAEEFQQTQCELRGVEAKVRRKLQELQQREVVVAAEEARLVSQRAEARKQADAAVRACEDTSRRQVAEAQSSLEVAQSHNRHLEAQIEELTNDLAAARHRLKDMESDLQESRRTANEAPVVKLQRELQEVELQLREQQGRTASIAASRDHFRRKVEELCERFPQRPLPASVPHQNAACQVFARPVAEHPISMAETAHAAEVAEVTKALRRFQGDLAQLAKDWTPEPAAKEASVASPGMPAGVAATQGSPRATQHLAWLRSQRQEMLDSGLYSVGDAVLQALDAKVAEAMAREGVFLL